MPKFCNPTLDLIRTYDQYEKHTSSKTKWKHTFGNQIVCLALGVISEYPREEDLIGIRRCIEFEIGQLKKPEYIFAFHFTSSELGDGIKIQNNQQLLSDSLILSIIEFRDHLNEHASGLASITKNKLRRGFELCCIWGSEGDLLKPNTNDWVITRENRKILKYISTAEHQKAQSMTQL
jgi:hypothetical protein